MRQVILFLCIFSFSWGLKSQTKVEATWESIQERGYPQWFSDAKLGIFIHWGLYSVPSWSGKEQYAEWFYRGLEVGDTARIEFQKKVFGKDFRYEDYTTLFKAELFNPDEWADLFKRSEAGYVLLVTKHHDGYCLWNSKFAPQWNSVVSGPKRDIVGELTQAVRKEGLRMGFYYSLAEWTNPLHRWYKDPDDSIARYVNEYMIPQFKELVTNYKPSVIFTDGEWSNSAKDWHAAELISWYYNTVGEEAIVNDRWGEGCPYGFRTPEYSAGIRVTDRPWAECRGVGRSFGLNRNEPLENYVTTDELIQHFAKLVACGGGLTLNVGPAADGQIPLLQQERLIELGNWIRLNREAIYGSRPYKKFTEEKDVEIQRIDSIINFDWVRNSPDKLISEDHFEAEWSGFVQPEYSEEYTFEAKADDGVRVWIDGTLLVDQWGSFDSENSADGNVQERKNIQKIGNKIKLKAGKKYAIKINYFENIQNASISLYWESKSQKKEVIPSKALFISDLSSTHGLQATCRSKRSYLCYTVNNNALYAILLEWMDNSLKLNIEKPSSDTKITLLGRKGELPWKYENNQLIVDLSSIKLFEIPCRSAWVFKIENGEKK